MKRLKKNKKLGHLAYFTIDRRVPNSEREGEKKKTHTHTQRKRKRQKRKKEGHIDK